MAWTGIPISTTTESGMDWLLYLLRLNIADQKQTVTQIVKEINDSGYQGVDDEIFYTKEMPLASGYDTQMFVDRWNYEAVESDAQAAGLAAYVLNVASGAFKIPAGALQLGDTDDTVKLSYSYTQKRKFKYVDDDLQYYLEQAVTEVNNGYYDFGHTVVTGGAGYTISPEPARNDIGSYVYAKYASYLIKKQLESEGFDNRIYVKDLNTTIDTTKGLGELAKSSSTLLNEINEIVNKLNLDGQLAAFGVVYKYGNYSADAGDYQADYNADSDFYKN